MSAWSALLAMWLSLPAAGPYSAPLPGWWAGGRVYSAPALHVGVRPAAALDGVGLTLQVSTGGCGR